jgi:hypothetical protein
VKKSVVHFHYNRTRWYVSHEAGLRCIREAERRKLDKKKKERRKEKAKVKRSKGQKVKRQVKRSGKLRQTEQMKEKQPN